MIPQPHGWNRTKGRKRHRILRRDCGRFGGFGVLGDGGDQVWEEKEGLVGHFCSVFFCFGDKAY